MQEVIPNRTIQQPKNKTSLPTLTRQIEKAKIQFGREHGMGLGSLTCFEENHEMGKEIVSGLLPQFQANHEMEKLEMELGLLVYFLGMHEMEILAQLLIQWLKHHSGK
ncbi:hypothetical protein Ahy_A06g029733 isoform A [Arachis hypogaea]|uniref:Uncharacterized protein n=1 Tax=Arachis hypogaea TaxID=3818 RepID=A0A445CU67_ARAHY|nr:hypothetical protein Ahy_A06g029733 isoform A [Arachis hypogaea]